VADELTLPVMVHVGDTAEPLPDLMNLLRRGDVVTHALTGRHHGILSADDTVHPAILDAQRAGIVFDAARGRNHLSFDVLARAAEQGFLPDTLSTDMSLPMARDLRYGLPTIANYLLAYGVPLHEALARMTVRPATVIGRDLAPALALGQSADLTVLALQHGTVTLADVDGRLLRAPRGLVAQATIRSGVYRAVAGAADSRKAVT
jgi:dihydroorotase